MTFFPFVSPHSHSKVYFTFRIIIMIFFLFDFPTDGTFESNLKYNFSLLRDDFAVRCLRWLRRNPRRRIRFLFFWPKEIYVKSKSFCDLTKFYFYFVISFPLLDIRFLDGGLFSIQWLGACVCVFVCVCRGVGCKCLKKTIRNGIRVQNTSDSNDKS